MNHSISTIEPAQLCHIEIIQRLLKTLAMVLFPTLAGGALLSLQDCVGVLVLLDVVFCAHNPLRV